MYQSIADEHTIIDAASLLCSTRRSDQFQRNEVRLNATRCLLGLTRDCGYQIRNEFIGKIRATKIARNRDGKQPFLRYGIEILTIPTDRR